MTSLVELRANYLCQLQNAYLIELWAPLKILNFMIPSMLMH